MPSEQVSNWVFATVVAISLTILVLPFLIKRKSQGPITPILVIFAGLVGLIGLIVTLDWLRERCSLSELLWLACPRMRTPWRFLFDSRHLWLLYGLLVPTGIVLAVVSGRRAVSAAWRYLRRERDDLA